MVKPSLVTSIVSLPPLRSPAKSRTVSSIPAPTPFTVTLGTVRLSCLSSLNVPGQRHTVPPDFTLMSSVCSAVVSSTPGAPASTTVLQPLVSTTSAPPHSSSIDAALEVTVLVPPPVPVPVSLPQPAKTSEPATRAAEVVPKRRRFRMTGGSHGAGAAVEREESTHLDAARDGSMLRCEPP